MWFSILTERFIFFSQAQKRNRITLENWNLKLNFHVASIEDEELFAKFHKFTLSFVISQSKSNFCITKTAVKQLNKYASTLINANPEVNQCLLSANLYSH